MSQSQALQVIEKEPDKWFTTKEVAKMLGINTSTVNTNLLSLVKQKEVIRERRRTPTGHLHFLWKKNGCKCSKCDKKLCEGKESFFETIVLCGQCFIKKKHNYNASSFWSKWIKETQGKKS